MLAFTNADGPLTQPFLHHVRANPISAAFALRYIHTLVRRWAASGKTGRCAPDIGTGPAEWYLGRMGIRQSGQIGRAVRAAAAAGACLMLVNCAQNGKFS